MRRFSSYGPVDTDLYYYVPRKELVAKGLSQLLGEDPQKGGYYFTVWAPRQCGKTWIMQQILYQMRKDSRFDILKINLETLKDRDNAGEIIAIIARKIGEELGKEFIGIDTQDKFQEIFRNGVLNKPLILILDEFDAMTDEGINAVVSAFRNIYVKRTDDADKPAEQQSYLLHSVALIGVRSVLGIENESGSPFNVQRSLHVPNLTREEVHSMFKWYQKESGQHVEPDAIDAIYDETRGQPGLVSWLGELLTETYNEKKDRPITMANYEEIFALAINVLPNTNILNIISKAKKEPYKQLVLEMFQTGAFINFKFDNKNINFLYMNGIIEPVKHDRDQFYARFSNPFVQKRLFNYFSDEYFNYMGRLVEPFDQLEDTITEDSLDTFNLIKRYQTYLQKNRDWLLKDAPRRKDLRIFEAVFHFNLYMFLFRFLQPKGGKVFPQFPTGNGKIDIVIKYKNRVYGLELKSFTDHSGYTAALKQAGRYAKQLELNDILLVFFIDAIDDAARTKYEARHQDKESGVTVIPIFVATGD